MKSITARRSSAIASLLAFCAGLLLTPGILAGLPDAENWARQPSPVGFWRDLALSADGRVVVGAGNPVGLFGDSGNTLAISTNSGRAWRDLNFNTRVPDVEVEHLAISGEGSRILAAGWELVTTEEEVIKSRRFFLSTDLGSSWQRIVQLPVELDNWNDYDVQISRDGQRIAVATLDGVNSTVDLGTTWTFTPFPPRSPDQIPQGVKLAMSADGGKMLASMLGDAANEVIGLHFISHDFGSSWRQVSVQEVDARIVELGAAAVSGDGQHLALLARFQHTNPPENLDTSPTIGVLMSNDGGHTWSRSATALQDGDVSGWPAGSFSLGEDLAMSDDGRHLLFGTSNPFGNIGVNPGPTVVSSDAGQTWKRLDLGYTAWTAISADGLVQFAAVEFVRNTVIDDPPGPLLAFGLDYPPEILKTQQSGNLALLDESPVTFTVSALGSTLNYEWRKDGVSLASAPNRIGLGTRSLTISSVTLTDLGTYSVRVFNTIGSVISEDWTLGTSITRPTIIQATQEGSTTLMEGTSRTFAVSADGQLLRYQWFRDGQALDEDSRHQGTQTRELHLTGVTSDDLGTYSVVVSNPVGTAERVVGKLEQTPPRLLSLTASPGPFVVSGDPVRLEVRAEGGGLAIRWFHNGVPLDASTISFGSSTNELLLPQVGAVQSGRYSATISNSLGQIESGDVTLALSSWRRTAVTAQDQTEYWHSASITADGRRMIVASPDRVLSSPDGGIHWNEHRTTNGIITTACVSANGNAVIVGQASGSYQQAFTDTSDPDWRPKWVSVSTGAYESTYGPRYEFIPSVVVSSRDGQIVLTNPKLNATDGLWLRWTYGYLARSQNGGLTWITPERGLPFGSSHGWTSPSCSHDGLVQVVRHRSWNFPWGSSTEDGYVSVDSGITWKRLSTPLLTVESPIAVSPDGSTVVIGAPAGIYLSKDLGQTWIRTAAPDQTWTRLCLSSDGQRLFAAGSGLIYQSLDGGMTWQWSGSPSANWRSLACSADGTQVIGAAMEGIFLSPALPDSTAEDVSASASRQTDGLHLRWQGQPHRTYHLLQTDQFSSSTEWLSIGAAVADAEGEFSLTSPGEKSHSFWRAVEVQ